MTPAIGTMVLYRITGPQAEDVNSRRAAYRQYYAAGGARTGHQEHHGNAVEENDQFAAMVVWRTDAYPSANLVVFLDGNDTLWAPSVQVGDGPGAMSLVLSKAPALDAATTASVDEQSADVHALNLLDEPADPPILASTLASTLAPVPTADVEPALELPEPAPAVPETVPTGGVDDEPDLTEDTTEAPPAIPVPTVSGP